MLVLKCLVKVKVKALSHVQPLATPWTATFQAPLSMGFSRQEYWSGVPLASPNISAGLLKTNHATGSTFLDPQTNKGYAIQDD